MMGWIALSLLIGAVAVAIVLFLLLRSRGGAAVPDAEALEGAYSDPGVEYEWTVGTSQKTKVVLLLLMMGALVGAIWLLSREGVELPGFLQAMLTGLGVFLALFSGLFRKKTYQITHDGLYVFSSNKKDRFRIFAWEHLLWFKPNDNGFKYYVRGNIQRDLPADKPTFVSGNSIYCGKQATLVNSIILARGVPTHASSPQNRIIGHHPRARGADKSAAGLNTLSLAPNRRFVIIRICH
jgi:hypothetical protein